MLPPLPEGADEESASLTLEEGPAVGRPATTGFGDAALVVLLGVVGAEGIPVPTAGTSAVPLGGVRPAITDFDGQGVGAVVTPPVGGRDSAPAALASLVGKGGLSGGLALGCPLALPLGDTAGLDLVLAGLLPGDEPPDCVPALALPVPCALVISGANALAGGPPGGGLSLALALPPVGLLAGAAVAATSEPAVGRFAVVAWTEALAFSAACEATAAWKSVLTTGGNAVEDEELEAVAEAAGALPAAFALASLSFRSFSDAFATSTSKPTGFFLPVPMVHRAARAGTMRDERGRATSFLNFPEVDAGGALV